MSLNSKVKALAKKLGFDACGITHAEPFYSEVDQFKNYLLQHFNGSMAYLERNFEKRMNPELLVPGTKSVIVLAASYFCDMVESGGDYKISRFALGKDYHKVMKKKAKPLVQFLKQEASATFALTFCDSAPVLEKAFAVRAGLGFIGKNSLLIIPGAGSFFFLACVFTDALIQADKPYESSHCGNCSLCIDACPSSAILKSGGLNASNCISYHTIESRTVGLQFSFDPGGWIFGCDICQNICPHNSRSKQAIFSELHQFKAMLQAKDFSLRSTDEKEFDSIFEGSSLKRCGYERLIRNMNAADEWK